MPGFSSPVGASSYFSAQTTTTTATSKKKRKKEKKKRKRIKNVKEANEAADKWETEWNVPTIGFEGYNVETVAVGETPAIKIC